MNEEGDKLDEVAKETPQDAQEEAREDEHDNV